MKIRLCAWCGQEIDPCAHGRRKYCNDTCSQRAWRCDNKWRVYKPARGASGTARAQYHRKLSWHGIGEAGYEALMVEQGGRCFICDKDATGERGNRLSVDHNHECCSGVESCGACVRGLLCYACNSGLGSFKDNPSFLRAAAHYLDMTKHKVAA